MTVTQMRPTSPDDSSGCNHGPVVLAQPKAWLNVAVTHADRRGRRVWCDQCLRTFEMDVTGALSEVDR